ncbi:hypothetical protein GCM10010124_23060 [Pilimelia terevasa]|uniref:Uncharacterized protein n=1 Tax=Pilimelia terevasa TaxID=53372 RepID=A0A8J3BUK2_9ACTN|nr:hypothetical protein [Pilimelia terevasa]GGK29709.1 hypothetical protein GCM10010124_23060 [Pilimelia terevasa]
MSTDTRNRMPNPLYAAAGAGDLAFQQLRKRLPAAVDGIRDRATTLRARSGDLDHLRAEARTAFATATVRAGEIYRDLVVRGERVVGHVDTTPGKATGVATVRPVRRPRGGAAASTPTGR